VLRCAFENGKEIAMMEWKERRWRREREEERGDVREG